MMGVVTWIFQVAKSATARAATSMCYLRRHHIFLFCISWAVVVVFFLYAFTDSVNTIYEYFDQGTENNVRLFRDVYTQEFWPEMETNLTSPGEIPFTVHYFWCGKKVFRFEHYLSVLSAERVLKPQKIIFHYHDLPVIDDFWYNTWFQELKQSAPNLVLRHTGQSPECGSKAVLTLTLGFMAREGGIYVGERTVVTHVPRKARSSSFMAAFSRKKPTSSSSSSSLSADVTQGVIYSKSGFLDSTLSQNIDDLLSSPLSLCYSVEEYDLKKSDKVVKAAGAIHRPSNGGSVDTKDCLVLWESLYPKDIWNLSTRFGELSRWLFYGHRRILQVQPDPPEVSLIPMISHIVWMKTNHFLKSNEFKFLHYLSVLSALYVAGFERVYIHGEILPYGHWWDRLVNHNVTFIKIEQPESVFQQTVAGPAHQSDVLRLNTLLRYGGVYQDRDVLWVSKIPRWLRRYQAVACNDWPRNGAWPEVFNMGVMMAKANAQWLKHFLKTFSYYRDDKWAFNAVMMPYKAYELHPDTLYVDRYLQVICFKGICHPAWHDDYIREIDDRTPVTQFDWHEARAFHFTVPKPPESLISPEAIQHGDDLFAGIGRLILEKSGQMDLLQ